MNPPALPVTATHPPMFGGQSPQTIRRLGWALVVLGPCIAAGMAWFAFYLAAMIEQPHYGGGASHWHGSREVTRLTFELLGAVFLIGGLVTLGGIYQVRHGRRSRALIILMLLTVAATIFFGFDLVTSK